MDNLFLRSMTGYGRHLLKSAIGDFEAELQGVNRRYRDLVFNLPRSLVRFESTLRREVESHIGRGQINIAIYFQPDDAFLPKLTVNKALVHRLKEAYATVARELEGDTSVRLEHLLNHEELFFTGRTQIDEKAIEEALLEVVRGALVAFTEMREAEGKWLGNDLIAHLKEIQNTLETIVKRSFAMGGIMRERLEKRLGAFFSEAKDEDKTRLLQEIALLSDRIDISEECVRLKSHLDAFRSTLHEPFKSANDTKGKRLDFLIQECSRELNTMASKAQDSALSHHVIEARAALEKMREQVQNIE